MPKYSFSFFIPPINSLANTLELFEDCWEVCNLLLNFKISDNTSKIYFIIFLYIAHINSGIFIPFILQRESDFKMAVKIMQHKKR